MTPAVTGIELAEERAGQGAEKATASAILTVISGKRFVGNDPGAKYKGNKTPNQKVLRMVAGLLVAYQRKDLALVDRYRDELKAYSENQRAIGFQCSDGSPDAWNLCEFMTSTHWPQWATAYYGALWCGLEYHDACALEEGEWFLSSELYFYDKCDPIPNLLSAREAFPRTGRVISACARAKGTESGGKLKPFIVEAETRNQVWLMANGMPRTDSKRHRNRLETAQDAPNIIARCLTRGWDFPAIPSESPKTFCEFRVTAEGSQVVTELVDAPGPQVVGRLAIQETRYDIETGAVEMIHRPPQAETPE